MVENTFETTDADYNSNRRTSKRKTKTRQLPGVSPLVFSRFLLEYTAFLSLSDMGKDLPDYEEIPVPLEMPEDVKDAYKDAATTLRKILKEDRKAAKKLLSAYMNLLTVYPDQPYDQPKMTEEFYAAVKKEIAAYQEKVDYLIKSGSRSPAVMDRWVLKIQGLEEKKKHYEQVLRRELDGLDDEFATLKFMAQELQVRAQNIRFQKAA